LVFTRLKHSHSFHKDDEEIKQISRAASGEDIQVVVVDDRSEKCNIYNDGERMLSTYYSNLPQTDARLTDKELSIIKNIKSGTRGATTTNNLFETADKLFLAKERI
jgi:hypothetical protein